MIKKEKVYDAQSRFALICVKGYNIIMVDFKFSHFFIKTA